MMVMVMVMVMVTTMITVVIVLGMEDDQPSGKGENNECPDVSAACGVQAKQSAGRPFTSNT